MEVFISHSSSDALEAQEICTLIEQNGHKCFLAPRDIRSGHEYAEEIINGIDRSQCMLLLLSEEANSSPHVLREVERAVSRKIPIIVYKLEDVQITKSMEYFLMTHQWLNEKSDKGYEEIVASINALSGQEKPIVGVTKSDSKNKKTIRIAIAAVAVIAIIAGVIIGIAGSNKSDPTEELTAEAAAQATAEADIAVMSAKPGDSIELGSYNGEPIEWRVISVSENGTHATVIADDILTMKCFDAAESGKFNTADGESYWNVPPSELDEQLQRQLRGDNRWETSNLRTWLNSERENVTYADQPPTAQAMAEGKNGYQNEAGFLNGFTEEELSAIVPTKITTNGTVTEDRVYLLSSDELALLNVADISIDADPTAAAVASDGSGWYTLYSTDFGVSDHYWWLRDAAEGDGFTNACEVYVVGNSYSQNKVLSDSASLEGFGVRPVMTVDLSSGLFTAE